MNPSMAELEREGVLSTLDVEFARALGTLGPESDEVLLALALASRGTRDGHVCVDLERLAGTSILRPDGTPVFDLRYPDLERLIGPLRDSRLVSNGERPSPLVLAPPARLYLRRYYEHETELARMLRARAEPEAIPPDPERLRRTLSRLFSPAPGGEPDLQRTAATIACLRRLCVISGGPGTGKTSTVVRLSALVLDRFRSEGRERPRGLFLAPTGKAAARLVEAVKRAKQGLPADLVELVPEEASTIHRALAPVGRSPAFRLGAKRLLVADLVVVDEASMVDVALMRRLVDAVPQHAHLVLLGDADQLSSVEAGAVLADVCGERRPYSPGLADELGKVFGDAADVKETSADGPGIDDCIVGLSRSYRFQAGGAIARLSTAIRAGDVRAALDLLSSQDAGEARLVPLGPRDQLGETLARLAIEGFSPALECKTVAEALSRLERFRILCAHRRFASGVESVNAFVEKTLASQGLIRPTTLHYPGRPILVTENDYDVRLFNGDQGIVWRDETGTTRAFFPAPDGELRAIATSRLPAHETAYATSIHKSQGSEYDDVVVLLPDVTSPLLSRELLYTAVSRARRRVTVLSNPDAVARAVEHRVERATGLRDALRAR